jgi:hypothetical protein
MIPEINYWAVLIGTVLSMALGAVWYSPAPSSTRASPRRPASHDARRGSPAIPLIVSPVVTFLTAWVLAGRSRSRGTSTAAAISRRRS